MFKYSIFLTISRTAIPILVMLMGSCSESLEPNPLRVTELITGKDKKTWVVQAVEVIDEGKVSGSVNFQSLVRNACRRDDAYVFYNNDERKFEYTNGASKCSATEDDILLEDEWEYQTANATLVVALPISAYIFGDILIFPYVVKKITDKEMILELYESKVFADPSNLSYRFIFSAQ